MGEDMLGCNTHLGKVLSKGGNACLRQGFGNPLALVLGEERKGGCSDFLGIERCILNSAACADMGADSFHDVMLMVVCG